MKRALALLLSVLCAVCAVPATASMPARDGRVELTGYVTAELLGSGYYSLGGYRLVTPVDLSVYAGREVKAAGYPDLSGTSALNSLVLTEITVSGETNVRNAAIEGALLYDYGAHIYQIRGRVVYYKGDISPYFGKYVRAEGVVDTQNVLQAQTLTDIDPAVVRRNVTDELFFATYHDTYNRLRYALVDMVAVNGAVKKDSLYQKLATQANTSDGAASLYLNGRRLYFDQNAQPMVKSSTLFAPLQPLCDALGLFQAQTFAPTDEILLSKGDFSITFTPGKRTALVCGKKVSLPAAPFLSKAGAMLPVKFLFEQMGYKTLYISKGKVFAAFK